MQNIKSEFMNSININLIIKTRTNIARNIDANVFLYIDSQVTFLIAGKLTRNISRRISAGTGGIKND